MNRTTIEFDVTFHSDMCLNAGLSYGTLRHRSGFDLCVSIGELFSYFLGLRGTRFHSYDGSRIILLAWLSPFPFKLRSIFLTSTLRLEGLKSRPLKCYSASLLRTQCSATLQKLLRKAR